MAIKCQSFFLFIKQNSYQKRNLGNLSMDNKEKRDSENCFDCFNVTF